MENENENNNENVGIDSNTSDNVNKVDNDSTLSPLNFALSGGSSTDIPRREENPFSLKHFLKRDSSLSGSGCTGTATITSSTATSAQGTTTTNLINHSRSTSNINGNNSINPNNNNNNNSTGKDSVSPSKSATTSSLHNNCVTGARPKIPQFQSVNTLTTESKMKRSPRFPSFDSQSSLNSEMNEDKINTTNLYHSRSNNSFNTEYPTVIPTSSSNNSSFVQRSYSNYDMDNPILELLQNSPNVYPSNRQNNNTPTMYSSNTAATGNRGGSEFSSALPDFVQDHLVMEQWYNTLGSGSPKSISPGSMDLDQLPDFAVNDGGGRLNMPFDLTYNSDGRNRNNSPTLPLDLPGNNNYPTLDIPFNLFPRRTDRRSPQLDLPPDLTDNNVASNRSGEPRPDQSGAESNKIQTLPDFLSDGPIHSSGRLADVTQDTPHNNSPDENSLNSTIVRLTNDNDRLRYELEDNRRNMLDQTRRIHELEKLLIPGPKRFEIFDENLEKQRTAAAQSSANKLKQQVKQLTAEIEILRRENESLREEGAVGGVRSNVRLSRSQQLSRDLKIAASNAEDNLRQLLSGVDNLRLMALTLENMNREIPNKDDEFLSDSDEHDFTGPAL